jgi:hypothetical protein
VIEQVSRREVASVSRTRDRPERDPAQGAREVRVEAAPLQGVGELMVRMVEDGHGVPPEAAGAPPGNLSRGAAS